MVWFYTKVSKVFWDRKEVQGSTYSCFKEGPRSKHFEVWFGQTPRSWDDYLKLLQMQIWAGSTEDRRRDISSTPHWHHTIKIWGTGRTVERTKESWFDLFRNCHACIASKVVIILPIAGSGSDTQMLWVNNGQLYNRSIDPQDLRAKVDRGGLLVKSSFYTDYRTEAWREEMACQGLRVELGFIPESWHVVNMVILNHHSVSSTVAHLDGFNELRSDWG